MRRLFLVISLLALPSLAFAQQAPQSTNKEAVLLQLIEDMKQRRAEIHPSEIEAAGCKVQLKQLQAENDALKKPADKPAEKAAK